MQPPGTYTSASSFITGSGSLIVTEGSLTGNGIWSSLSNGNWSTTGNWLNGTVADGTDALATFAQATGVTVTLATTLGTSNFQVDGAGVTATVHAPWNIPHYECDEVATRVMLRGGANDLLVKLVQPDGQRTRSFVAFDPPRPDAGSLALRWFTADGLPRPCLLAGAERRAIRFRFMSPPGLREMMFVSRGPARVWVGGEEITATPIAPMPGGCIRYRALIESAVAEQQAVAIRVEAPADSHAGDALPEPVAFTCGAGVMHAGDWCAQGLATYSGAVGYKRSVSLTGIVPGQSVHLDLGTLSATAEVRVNGQTAATLVTPPWRCDLTSFLQLGVNELSITVANTLANHYSVGIPTPYAFENQTPSGLFGPVTLVTTS